MSKQCEPPKIEKEKLLIVEGIDEVVVISQILKNNNIEDIQLIPFGGKSILKNYMKDVLIKDSNFLAVKSIGIIRDADDNYEGAFDSVCSALRSSGLDVPNSENEKTVGNPMISILILPGNSKNGSLENIFIDSVQDDPLINCVDQYFNCVSEVKGNIPKQIGKAKVHVFLSANINDPDKRLGESVKAGIWNLNNTAFYLLHKFINQL